MNFLIAIAMLANLAYLAAAAAMSKYKQTSDGLEKRTEVTFAWKQYAVQNCSALELERNPPEKSVLAEDCQWVLNMITSNNGGYFELWDFETHVFKPIIGYQSCVLAVYHSVNQNASDYAIIGNEDVANVMRVALKDFQDHDGHVATLTGGMYCGPNNASVGLLVYNGMTGGVGGPVVNASTTTMIGDAWSRATGTGRPPPLPSVSRLPVSVPAPMPMPVPVPVPAPLPM